MQNFLFSVLGILASLISTSAFAESINPAHLSRLKAQVAKCSVIPVSERNGNPLYHALTSHCPEIKVVGSGVARLKFGGHSYNASILPTSDSDGDFYAVQITDLETGAISLHPHVLAFGDVLLGVLDGRTDNLAQKPLADFGGADVDQFLLK